MDIDGVDAESPLLRRQRLRYLTRWKEGWREGTPVQDALVDFRGRRPSASSWSYQIPIHEIDVAVQEVERVAELGGKSLPAPVFPNELASTTTSTSATTRCGRDQAADLPICCHIGHNAALGDLQRRDPRRER
jgi:hypothetical protein